MKIANLGYNTIVKSDNTQQNTPVFKGKVYIMYPKVTENLLKFLDAKDDFTTALIKRRKRGVVKLNMDISTKNGQEIVSVTFDSRFDTKAKKIIDELRAKYAGIGIKFKFGKGRLAQSQIEKAEREFIGPRKTYVIKAYTQPTAESAAV